MTETETTTTPEPPPAFAGNKPAPKKRSLKEKVNAAYGKGVGDKPVKLTKSKAAELKDALEARQVGAEPKNDDITITLTSGGKTVETSSKKMAAAAKHIRDNAAETSDKRSRAHKKFDAAIVEAIKPRTEQRDFVDDKTLKIDLSPLGKWAKEFKELIVKKDAVIDAIAEKSAEGLKVMEKANRLRYQIEGYAFEVSHTGPKDQIRVVKPK